ncbi:MAG: 50S ribosomal protein L10, partial [Bacteroidota bacterium]
MTREEKAEIIDALVDKFKGTDYFYITDASGFNVAQVNKLRRECFEAGVEYKVIKNSLIKKALERLDTDYTPFVEQKVLKGFSGVMFSPESVNQPAKVIKAFRKEQNNDKPLLKGASVDTALFIGNDQLDTLASMKSKTELIGDIVGLLQSPAKNVISALKGQGSKVASILQTL